MRNAFAIAVLATMAGLTSQTTAEEIWDFSYGYDNVYSANANDYDFSVSNAIKANEGGVTSYYQPAAGNLDPAVITKKFSFANATQDAHLWAGISTFNWWYGEGHGYVYASKDGLNWDELTYVGPPQPNGANYSGFNDYLPSSVLGGTELWVKVVINSTNTSSYPSNPAYRNTAQHSRGYADGNDSFHLDVKLIPEPGTLILLITGGVLILCLRTGRFRLS